MPYETPNLIILLFSLTAPSFAQIIYTASAVIPFDSSLLEIYSGTAPTTLSPSSFTFIEDRNGNPNSAVQLNAILDYGNPAFSKMDSSDFTIAFWFRKDGSLWAEKSILQKKNVDMTDPNNVIYEQYGIFYNDWVGHSAQIRFKPSNDSAEVSSALGLIEDSVWRHFAIVFDRSDSMHAYLDGQLYQSKYIGNTVQYEANIDGATLEVGNGNISLDDIYLFKYALDASEIEELFNSESASITIPYCPSYYEFGIYPNPSTTGVFNITFQNEFDESVQIQVYDMLGKEVGIVRSQNHPNIIEFRLGDPAAGNYQLHIESDEYRIVEMILVN
ncbi:MAG: hypothetical protein COA38_07915 [Fluviicola sp.]|nr:MAG: hypothetical protein COA38_07915 [Fluviicola sp.]